MTEIKRIFIQNKDRLLIIISVLAIAFVGAILLSSSFGAGFSIAKESEDYSLTGGVTVKQDDPSASPTVMPKYIQFASEAVPPVSNGDQFYVDCNAGSDRNSGLSEALAWKTINKVSAVSFNPGDAIFLRKGCVWNNQYLTLTESGTSSDPIVIDSYGSGNLPELRRDNNGSVVTLKGSNVVVQNLKLVGVAPSIETQCNNNPVGNIRGVLLDTGAQNNVIQNMDISGFYAGVFFNSGSSSNKLLNSNLSNNNMMSPLDTSSDNDAGAFGVLLWGSNNEIAYNNFTGHNACSYDYTLDGAAVEVYGGTASQDASNNNIHHNTSYQDNAFTELGKRSSSPSPDGNTYAYNTYFANGISNAIFVVSHGTNDNFGPVTHTKAYNNSVYINGSSKWGFYCGGTCSDGSESGKYLTFKNNIIATSNSNPIPYSGPNISNNIGWVIGSSNNNPNFKNISTQDLRLTASSTNAIDKGTNETLSLGYNKDLDGKTVPIGSNLDIGAYEFDSLQASIGNSEVIAKTLNNLIGKATAQLKAIGNILSTGFNKLIQRLVLDKSVNAQMAVNSVTIATVGDMNPSGNKSTSSHSGKNAAEIIAGLQDGSIDYFFGLGDFQYTQGTCSTLVNEWGSLWSPVIPKTFTIAGPTHDMASISDELGYRLYFNGQCSGSTAKSAAVQQLGRSIGPMDFYSFDVPGSNWHFVALPTTLWRYDSSTANSVTAQLDADLAAAKAAGKQLGAMYHDPYFTSKTSSHDREYKVKPWIDILDKHDVRLSLSGSQHNYERSCPILKDDTCTPEDGEGTTAFNVSTGGIGLRSFADNPSYIDARFDDTHGWMELTLYDDGAFDWQFHPVSGSSTDSGSRIRQGGGPNITSISPSNGPANGGNEVVIGGENFQSGANVKFGSVTASTVVFNDSTSITAYAPAGSPGTVSVTVINPDGTTAVNSAGYTYDDIPICPDLQSNFGSASVEYTLPVSGNYRVWLKLKGDVNRDSLYVKFGSGCHVIMGDSGINNNGWTWVNWTDGNIDAPAEFTLGAGIHMLTIIGREPDVKLDRVIVTTDANCVGEECLGIDNPPLITDFTSYPNTIVQGEEIILSLTATDDDGPGISHVNFYDDSTLLGAGVAAGPTYSYKWVTSTSTNVGQHRLSAIVYDLYGKEVKSNTINVNIDINDSPTLNPIKDAFVSRNSPTTNYGTTSTLEVDNGTDSEEISYISFLIDTPAGKEVATAILKLNVTNSSGNDQGIKIAEDELWNEQSINYNSKLTLGNQLAQFSSGGSTGEKVVDVSSIFAGRSGVITLGIDQSPTSSDGMDISSRESSNPPKLELTYRAATTNNSDLNQDGVVDIVDLSILLSAWGSQSNSIADINSDGLVDIVDLSILLSDWA